MESYGDVGLLPPRGATEAVLGHGTAAATATVPGPAADVAGLAGGAPPASELVAPRRSLLVGVPAIDRFLGPLVGGQVVLLRGLEHAPGLMPRIVVGAVLELGEDVVLVDGGNAADPYRLSAACRRLGARPEDVLPRVHVARAFTSFQMSAIIEDALPRAVEEHAPGLLAVLSVDELYNDENVGRDQAVVLLGRAMDRIRSLAEQRGLVAVLGDSRAHRARPGDRFGPIVDARVHDSVTFERRSRRTIRLRRRDGTAALLASAPPGQLTLDDFRYEGRTGRDGTGQGHVALLGPPGGHAGIDEGVSHLG